MTPGEIDVLERREPVETPQEHPFVQLRALGERERRDLAAVVAERAQPWSSDACALADVELLQLRAVERERAEPRVREAHRAAHLERLETRDVLGDRAEPGVCDGFGAVDHDRLGHFVAWSRVRPSGAGQKRSLLEVLEPLVARRDLVQRAVGHDHRPLGHVDVRRVDKLRRNLCERLARALARHFLHRAKQIVRFLAVLFACTHAHHTHGQTVTYRPLLYDCTTHLRDVVVVDRCCAL